MTIERPARSEYSDYYAQYVDRVPEDGDVLAVLAHQVRETAELFGSLTLEQGRHRYAPGKWSLAEVLGHLVDSERIMATRALVFARGEKAAYPGFEQDDYVPLAHFDQRGLLTLVEEFTHLRAANLALFRSLDSEALVRSGTADDKQLSVRAIVYLLAGHESHHLGVVRERYL